jgi:hypothetical protein
MPYFGVVCLWKDVFEIELYSKTWQLLFFSIMFKWNKKKVDIV